MCNCLPQHIIAFETGLCQLCKQISCQQLILLIFRLTARYTWTNL